MLITKRQRAVTKSCKKTWSDETQEAICRFGAKVNHDASPLFETNLQQYIPKNGFLICGYACPQKIKVGDFLSVTQSNELLEKDS